MKMDKEKEKMRIRMRKKGAFSKYCSSCGEIIASDDMKEFISKMGSHNCKK